MTDQGHPPEPQRCVLCDKPTASAAAWTRCPSCGVAVHQGCVKVQAGTPPTSHCPHCDRIIEWRVDGARIDEALPKASVEFLKTKGYHKVVRVGIREQHLIDAKANLWSGRETVRVDDATVVNQVSWKEKNTYRLRVGVREQYDIAVTMSSWGGVHVETFPVGEGGAPVVQMFSPPSVDVKVVHHSGCLGCGCGLLIALPLGAIGLLIGIFAILTG